MPTNPNNSGIIRDSKRRMAKTSAGQLAKLFAERSRWMRKQTIASNKLAGVQKAIDRLAQENAATLAASEWNGGAS
jgi:hypothetical protein